MSASTTKNTNRKVTATLVALSTMLAAILVLSNAVSAQGGPTGSCSGTSTNFGTEFFGVQDGGNRLLSTTPTERVFSLDAALPAGTYDLNAVSYDGYPNRDIVPAQAKEQWSAQLLDAAGATIATTGTTGDIADEVLESTWTGSVGSVTLDRAAVAVRIVHAAPGDPSVNSVRPVCLGASLADTGDTGGEDGTEGTDGDGSDGTDGTDGDGTDGTDGDGTDGTGGNGDGTDGTTGDSSVSVNFEGEGDDPAMVSLICGDRSDSANGRSATLEVDGLEGGDECTITVPADRECDLTITPGSTEIDFANGGVVVTVPVDGNTDILVEVKCSAPGGTLTDGIDTEVEGETETNDGDSNGTDGTNGSGNDGNTTDDSSQAGSGGGTDGKSDGSSINVEVQGQTETATAQTGTPSFTG